MRKNTIWCRRFTSVSVYFYIHLQDKNTGCKSIEQVIENEIDREEQFSATDNRTVSEEFDEALSVFTTEELQQNPLIGNLFNSYSYCKI